MRFITVGPGKEYTSMFKTGFFIYLEGGVIDTERNKERYLPYVGSVPNWP